MTEFNDTIKGVRWHNKRLIINSTLKHTPNEQVVLFTLNEDNKWLNAVNRNGLAELSKADVRLLIDALEGLYCEMNKEITKMENNL